MSTHGGTTGDETFTGTLRTALENGATPEEAAALVIDQPEYRDHLMASLRTRAALILRNINRAAEHRAEDQWQHGNPLAARRELVGHTFALPDGRFVEWTKATAADHRARAQWQRRYMASIQRDIRLHEVAAQVIEEAGVECLDQIESLQPWPELTTAVPEIEAK